MTEFLPTRRALIAAAVLFVLVAMVFLATRAATGLDTVPTDLPNVAESTAHAGTATGMDVPAVPNVEPVPTVPPTVSATQQTPTTVPATKTTFSERLQDRAESGGGEYLPGADDGFRLDAPATTVAEVVVTVIESTTTTVEVPAMAEVPPAEYLPEGADITEIASNPPAYLPECADDETGPEFDGTDCYWDATVRGNGQGDSYFQWNGTAYRYDPAATVAD